ncbi:MAG: (d)CMP kinase [Dermatophilaceae bacterium]
MTPPAVADPDRVEAVVALAALSAARPSGNRCLVVAIDGPSGAGKTTLGQAVSTSLQVPLLRMDHLYPGWDGLEHAVDLLADAVLAPLAAGQDGSYPFWDWDLGKVTGQVTVPWTPTLVVEGCGSSAGAAAAYSAVRVWVEAPAEVRRERALARDGDAYRPHWERWAAQERRLFSRDGTRERADLVVST